MNMSGELDGDDLVITRTFRATIDDVWACVTESDRLSRWYGTWAGDPDDGFVMVTMTAEAEDVPPMRLDISECVPPRRLVVRSDSLTMSVDLSSQDGVTTLVFRHFAVDRAGVGEWGSGWEWYLDRLAAAVDGSPLPSLADFDTYMESLADAYRALA